MCCVRALLLLTSWLRAELVKVLLRSLRVAVPFRCSSAHARAFELAFTSEEPACAPPSPLVPQPSTPNQPVGAEHAEPPVRAGVDVTGMRAMIGSGAAEKEDEEGGTLEQAAAPPLSQFCLTAGVCIVRVTNWR